jgi:phospholipid/cholesterol/gamma-HCH transport system substrate-binding protein
MQQYRRIEITVGVFVFLGIVAMSWLAVKIGQIGGLGQDGYHIEAVFADAGGVRVGSDVMMAGVVIGRVSDVALQDNEKAKVTLQINTGVQLSTDVIASVRTKGIIGERYIRITQGADTDLLAEGDEVEETESAINIEDLISKYIFSAKEQ